MTNEELIDPAALAHAQGQLHSIRDGLARVILGQDNLIDLVTIALAARGHVLLEGLPGLGKTQLVRTLGDLLRLPFGRVQFTPDLLPTDITGGPILQDEGGTRRLVFQPGPLFANLVLADEINRASAKTQSALLEAMQERRVTVLGEAHPLPLPFFVLATQNPIELEGTYPLPEAQLDRFLFKIDVPGVSTDVLSEILRTRRHGEPPAVEAVLDADGLQTLFAAVDRVYLPDPVARYIARVTSATHPTQAGNAHDMGRFIRYGASPRAAIAMAEGARAAALLAGRPNVDFDDVARVAPAALRHRVVLDHTARIEGMDADTIVARVIESVDPLERGLPREVS